MDKPSCTVCTLASAKYKCPICLSGYCSVPCYKEHKSGVCVPPVATAPVVTEEYDEFEEFELEDTTGVDYVPLRKLELLRHSKHLKDLLSNPHLRSYLQNIDNSRRPDLAMEKAMREPLFIEFADECLRIILDEQPK
ncbi:HIT zinc finger [Opisthorchis viverrini]|uniref:HIT zinc finger n=2 Tax=Opisthorchis viverrini TaxID=6198 RepID=A0A1S8WGP9_OPIVI|nr:hypothetical protein T265_10136 [Opisthorchis viverrini]KER21566.1 hypothetical protein T265_10136 [Opisthorchis viverrini]OON13611.1 HIT zinc finger [Opisthorchis viverrini]